MSLTGTAASSSDLARNSGPSSSSSSCVAGCAGAGFIMAPQTHTPSASNAVGTRRPNPTLGSNKNERHDRSVICSLFGLQCPLRQSLPPMVANYLGSTQPDSRLRPNPLAGSFLDVALYGPGVVHADIDVARVVHGHAFSPGVGGGAGPLFGRSEFRNEGGDLAVLHAADPDAAFEARVLRHVGFGIGDIEEVVLVDEEAARAAELLPFRHKRTVRVEDFDTVVGSIGDVDAARRIDRHRMVDPELPGAGAALSPRRDELAVGRELDDPRVGVATMAVAYDDVTVAGNRDIGRGVEHIGAHTGDPGFAERQRDLALRTELDDHVALAVAGGVVGRPHVALAIDMEPVGGVEVTLAKACHKLSGGIEFVDRIERGVDAVSCSAALEHPNALAVGIDIDARHLPELTAVGDFQPISVEAVWIGGPIRVGGHLRKRYRSKPGRRRRGDP